MALWKDGKKDGIREKETRKRVGKKREKGRVYKEEGKQERKKKGWIEKKREGGRIRRKRRDEGKEKIGRRKERKS